MALENKLLTYGLKRLAWALVTETVQSGVTSSSYTTPADWLGAISVDLQSNATKNVIRADDGDYWVNYGEGSYTGTLNVYQIPADLETALEWYKRDDNGLAVESSELYKSTKYLALLMEFQNDVRGTRHCFYKVALERPNITSETTGEDGTITPNQFSINITATPRADADKFLHTYADRNSTQEAYDAFYTAVPIPTFTPPSP